MLSLAGARILAIAPHPDDESLGCGGTIARVLAEGGDAAVIVVSTSDLVQHSASLGTVTGDTRISEFREAMAVLGVAAFELLFDSPEFHMRLDTIPQIDLIKRIERDARLSIERFRPDVLLLPAPSYNQDHDAVFRAGFAACRPHLPSDRHFVPIVLSYDQPQLGWAAKPFHPTFHVDISDYLDQKLEACGRYRSQLFPAPHHFSLANIEHCARVRGAAVSVAAAEAFHCLRMLL